MSWMGSSDPDGQIRIYRGAGEHAGNRVERKPDGWWLRRPGNRWRGPFVHHDAAQKAADPVKVAA